MHDRAAADAAQAILVVEDEFLIRLAVADYLQDCGYLVFEAGSVDEAIALLRAESRIDIVFSDINMPGDRNGFDLYGWVGENKPGVRVILTSGGTQVAELARNLCEAAPLIPKPYYFQTVLDHIRTMLEADRGRL